MAIGDLGRLERLRDRYGPGLAARKRELLERLDRTRLSTGAQVERLHEALCFLRAYPDDARVLALAGRMLARFDRRPDLRRHRESLADSGIAGTPIRYRFFWPTARWLAHRWPGALRLDRTDEAAGDNIGAALPQLVTRFEASWLRGADLPAFGALDLLRGRQCDATFLVRAVDAMPGDSFTREAFYDALDPSCELAPTSDTPSRTRANWGAARIAFQRTLLRRARPALRDEIPRPPRAVRALAPAGGERIIELARGAMITRKRDLDAFAYGDRRDVRIVDDGAGLAFALIGVQPERRTLLPAVYGILTLQNGVPIGYGQADVLGRSAAISFNTFATFRGGEAARTFARMLACVRHVLGAESFSIEPYQLGEGNKEGLESGAWWFYYKMGFRPRAAPARRILRAELARMAARERHRSSIATLAKLARWHVFFELDPSRRRGVPPADALARRVAGLLGRRAAGDRQAALEACSAALLRITGMRSLAGFGAAERQAWRRWSPLVLTIPGLARWPLAERRALARIVRAKGARRESDFARAFDVHPRLTRALLGWD
jgi:hypothetical protein